jgi:L-alanine-DL-glutamate epimerase-like enolase superfamily enzyme
MALIKNIEIIPLANLEAKPEDCDGTAETVVVRIFDENGISGIGECDAPAYVVKSFLEMPTQHIWSKNTSEILVGSDPIEVQALWEKIYEGTCFPGRRGLGIHALSAIDIALHDLAGKQLGIPAYKILGGAKKESLRPYCTIFPGLPHGRSIQELMKIIGQQFEKALSIGFDAVKMEVMFENLIDDNELIEQIKLGRKMLGDKATLAIDFGYRWKSWADAKWVLDRIEDCNIYFAEAALQHDDLAGHARLAKNSSIRIGGAEHSATRFEAREWMETGEVHVIQCAIDRAGGLTEMMRIAELAEYYGVDVIPHGWKTGITSSCGCHFQAASPTTPIFEFISPDVFDSPLRKNLVSPEAIIKDGRIELPKLPGLGIELNEDALEYYRTDK